MPSLYAVMREEQEANDSFYAKKIETLESKIRQLENINKEQEILLSEYFRVFGKIEIQ